MAPPHQSHKGGLQNTRIHKKDTQTPMVFFLQAFTLASHTHTCIHTHSTHTRPLAEASTLAPPYKLTNMVSTTHRNTRDTHKLRWTFSCTHAKCVSQTHHTHTQKALTQGPWQRHPHLAHHSKLTKVVLTTHTYTTNTHKHPWTFSYKQPHRASHTHTFTHTSNTRFLCRGIHIWIYASKLTNMDTPTHMHTTKTHNQHMVFFLQAYT